MSLQDNMVKISPSANGKQRVIEWIGINTRWDLKVITILTKRRFFEGDDNAPDGLGVEITGKIDFPEFEHNLTASNDKLCNPANGLMVSPVAVSGDSGTTVVFKDAAGNTVGYPIGLFDFFRPLLSQPVSQNDLIRQNIVVEDSVYKTWDK